MLLSLLFVLPTLAADALDLKDAVQRALDHNPDLAQAGYALEQAEAAVSAAKAAFDPSLTGSGSWSDAEMRGFFQGFAYSQTSSAWDASAGLSGALPTGTGWSVGASTGWDSSATTSALFPTSDAQKQEYYSGGLSVGIQQNLLAGILPSYNLRGVRSAKQAQARTATAQAQVRENLVSQVTSTWWTWTVATNRERIAASALDAAKATEAAVRVRASEGRLTDLEVGQAELARLQAESDVVQADSDTRQALDTLLVLLGEAPGADLTPAPVQAMEGVNIGPVETWEERALATNPDLALARADLDAARLATKDARHAILPTLTAQASATLNTQTETLGDALSGLPGDDSFPTYGAGLDLRAPLGNRAARADLDRTTAAENSARAQVEGLERSIRALVATRHRAVRTAGETAALATSQQALAERNAKLEKIRFDEGTRTLDRLLDANLKAEQAALANEQAVVTLVNAIVNLHLLVGGVEGYVNGLR